MLRLHKRLPRPFGGAGATLLILLLGIIVGGFVVFALGSAGVLFKPHEKKKEKLAPETRDTLLATLLPLESKSVAAKLKVVDERIKVKLKEMDEEHDQIKHLAQELREKKRKMEVEEKRRRAEAERTRLEKSQLVELKTQIQKLQSSLGAELIKVKLMEEENLKKLAKVWGRMEAESTAKLVLQMPDLDQVAKIFYLLKDRKQAEILQALGEEGVEGTKRAVELTEKLRTVKFEVAATGGAGTGAGP